jgi:hypothetical protein
MPCAKVSLPFGCKSNAIPADDVLGAGTCSSPGTASRMWSRHVSAQASTACCAQHSDALARNESPPAQLTVAIGINLGLGSIRNSGLGSAKANCLQGNLLACAAHTWMASGMISALGLVDCAEAVRPPPRDKRRLYGSLEPHFARPSFLHSTGEPSLLCYWLPYVASSSYRKSAVLFAAMLTELSGKDFYLKVDADTVLRPQQLGRFLERVATAVDPSIEPIYFGNALGPTGPPACPTKNPTCSSSFVFNTGPQPKTRRSKGNGTRLEHSMRLRETAGWRELQDFMLARTFADPRLNDTSITYATGGAYGCTRRAAELLVRSDCMQRLGRLPCSGCRGRNVHANEDAAFGLCMGLVNASLLQCDCFHTRVPYYEVRYLGLNAYTGSSLPTRLSNLTALPQPSAAARRYVSNSFQYTRPIIQAAGDLQPLPRGLRWLCQEPIALHPVVSGAEHLAWGLVLPHIG